MSAQELIDMLATVENDPDVPAYARAVAAEAVRAMPDAVRWQWMRANWTRLSSYNGKHGPSLKVEPNRWTDWTEDAIDAAIDAAREIAP